jgi:hypothetical protein
LIRNWKKALSICILSGASFAITPAHAGGMPNNEASSILDQALQDIQRNTLPVKEPEKEITYEPEPVKEILAEPPVMEEPAPAPTPVVAEPAPEPVAPVPQDRIVNVQRDTSFFGLSVGLYDAFKTDDLAASFGVEWQPGVKIAGVLQPLFGAFVTSDGSFLGYGGVGVPVKVHKNWMIMPSVSAGYYEEGDGFDLDRKLAYRVGAEIAYVFENESRLGLNVHTITNGTSLDTDDRTEIISIKYTTPLGNIPGFRKK